MNSNTFTVKLLTKFHCGMIIMSLTLTLLIVTSFRVSYIKQLRQDVIQNFYEDQGDVDINYDDYIDAKFAMTIEKIDNIMFMKQQAQQINDDQIVYNQDVFDVVRSSTYVIVIQVHDDTIYLKALVQSLKYTMGITHSLLIFSHDFYDEQINSIIHDINFAKYIQIFYPYNSQFYPRAYPGNDHTLCTKDFECEKSVMRSESLAQKKLFWWWQANQIFDRLKALENYNGTVVFLKEDQYVLKDFIFMLKVLESLMTTACSKCEIISLGPQDPALTQYDIVDGNLTISSWNSTIKNIGIGFNRTVWNSIKEFSYHFCHYNDYRWDASLRYLGSKRPEGKFMVLSSDAPRVIRYKQCNGNINCTKIRNVVDVLVFVRMIHRGLYPRNINIQTSVETESKINAKEYWEDVRDQGLCMYFVKE